jgi:hypothetical protein
MARRRDSRARRRDSMVRRSLGNPFYNGWQSILRLKISCQWQYEYDKGFHNRFQIFLSSVSGVPARQRPQSDEEHQRPQSSVRAMGGGGLSHSPQFTVTKPSLARRRIFWHQI